MSIWGKETLWFEDTTKIPSEISWPLLTNQTMMEAIIELEMASNRPAMEALVGAVGAMLAMVLVGATASK